MKKSILPTKQRWSVTAAITALPLFFFITSSAMALEPTEDDYELKLLGKYLFFDKISVPGRQSCSSCHTPDAGGTNGVSGINLKQVAVTGANPHTVGTLKPPTNTYATLIPKFHDAIIPIPFPPFIITVKEGGNFWDGRVPGTIVESLQVLGAPGSDLHNAYAKYFTPTTDQAHASPFVNPVEQGHPDIIAVCEHVKSAKYAPLYAMAYGEDIDCNGASGPPPARGTGPVVITFGRLALALGAYQASKDVSPWDSKRDLALASDSDGKFPLDDFTDQENLGHDIFYNIESALNPDPDGPEDPTDPTVNPLQHTQGNCNVCHRSGAPDGTSLEERYTDDRFFNIGTPRNTEIPGNPEPSIGLQGTTTNSAHEGLQKVPTLRNVDKRRGNGFIKAYTHAGFFKSLESIVHFYNTARIIPGPGPGGGAETASSFGVIRCPEGVVTEKDALALNCWPAPGIPANRAPAVLVGNLGLTLEEEAALVAYLKTLSDTSTYKAPTPFSLRKFNRGRIK